MVIFQCHVSFQECITRFFTTQWSELTIGILTGWSGRFFQKSPPFWDMARIPKQTWGISQCFHIKLWMVINPIVGVYVTHHKDSLFFGGMSKFWITTNSFFSAINFLPRLEPTFQKQKWDNIQRYNQLAQKRRPQMAFRWIGKNCTSQFATWTSWTARHLGTMTIPKKGSSWSTSQWGSMDDEDEDKDR